MPVNRMEMEDDDKEDQFSGARARFEEFECPSCDANNPCDPPFAHGDEVFCNYCGSSYLVKVTEEGKAKFKEI